MIKNSKLVNKNSFVTSGKRIKERASLENTELRSVSFEIRMIRKELESLKGRLKSPTSIKALSKFRDGKAIPQEIYKNFVETLHYHDKLYDKHINLTNYYNSRKNYNGY